VRSSAFKTSLTPWKKAVAETPLGDVLLDGHEKIFEFSPWDIDSML
jgi:hypothetical protein